MLTLSWSTFRDRWALFVGAVASIAVGVALTQSALMVAASATPPTRPGLSRVETEQLRAAYDDVATVRADPTSAMVRRQTAEVRAFGLR